MSKTANNACGALSNPINCEKVGNQKIEMEPTCAKF